MPTGAWKGPILRRAKWGVLIVILVGGALAMVWPISLGTALRTFRECLRPTTVLMMPINECTPTDAVPPPNLMQIVDIQQRLYHLTLQKVSVCFTSSRLPTMEEDFGDVAFSAATRARWLPLYMGCCSYQFRRHVTVVAARAREGGSIIVEAALIQGRWDFFIQNWRTDRPYWF